MSGQPSSVGQRQPACMDLRGKVFGEFLKILGVVEKRKRRVRAIWRDSEGHTVGEVTVRNGAVEPGVMVRGEVFADARVRRDAKWLHEVLNALDDAALNSAELSRKLIRSTRKRDQAEEELRGLTARALLELAEVATTTRLEVEFDKSGPKRGPVYSFPTIELLATVCEEHAGDSHGGRAFDALTPFADALWCFRRSLPGTGIAMVPVRGTQGESSAAETLALGELAEGLLGVADYFARDTDGTPVGVHLLGDGDALAFVADGDELAIASFSGPRRFASMGPTRNLVELVLSFF